MDHPGSPHATQICTPLGGLLSVESFLSEDRQGVIRHFLRKDGLDRSSPERAYHGVGNVVRDNLVYLRAIVILAKKPAYRTAAAGFLNKAVSLIEPKDPLEEKFRAFLKEVLPR